MFLARLAAGLDRLRARDWLILRTMEREGPKTADVVEALSGNVWRQVSRRKKALSTISKMIQDRIVCILRNYLLSIPSPKA